MLDCCEHQRMQDLSEWLWCSTAKHLECLAFPLTCFPYLNMHLQKSAGFLLLPCNALVPRLIFPAAVEQKLSSSVQQQILGIPKEVLVKVKNFN